MKLYRLAIILALFSAGAASAQVGRTGVPFLLIAPGARAAGMGEAFIAISDDATAVHWNPAGLGRYPLTGTWLTFKGAPTDTMRALVLIKNNTPEVNYRQYDLWGIVNNRLAKWDGAKWISGVRQDLKSGGSLQSLIVRYTGMSDKEAEPYVDKLARSNNELAPESIDSLKERIIAVLPAIYTYKEEIGYGFEKLHKAWLQLRIDLKGIDEIRSDIDNTLADSAVSIEKLDKIAFGFDRAITTKGDRRVWIPFNLILPDRITSLGSDDEYVYVGTSNGLFKMDPQKYMWFSYSSKTDSLPSDFITSICKAGRHTMFVGTDKGITTFTGRNFKAFPPEAEAPSGRIVTIAALDDRNAWAASDSDLYHYDGIKWRNAQEAELSIGESAIREAEKFYGELGAVMKDKIMVAVAQANSNLADSAVAGQVVKLPYRQGYRGEITGLGVDQKGRLWIGTTTGIDLFDGERFHLYGYKLYEAPQATTVQKIAAQFIPDRDQEKVDKLGVLIKQYNELSSDQVDAGAKLLVFANALGSEVKAISPVSGKKTVVATDLGVVEYDNGKWSRMHNVDMPRSSVSNIYSRGGELWFSEKDKVMVYASPKKQITFMHSNYLVQLANDLYYEYFSFVYPTADWGTFGLGVTFLSLGKQARTDEFANQIGLFYTYEMALTLSYGARMMNNTYGGISLRYINSHLSDVGAGKEKGSGVGYSVAVDGGVIYQASRRLTLATTVTNIGPDIAYIDADQADPLPRKLAVGCLYKLVDSPFNKVSLLAEATKLLVDLNHSIKTEVEEIIPHVGVEYWYSNYVALRGGYVYDKVGVQRYFTLGASLQYTNYRFDFSYIPSSNENFNRLGNTIRFSMNVGF